MTREEAAMLRNGDPVEVWHRGKWRRTTVDTSADDPGKFGGIHVAPLRGDAVGYYTLDRVRAVKP